METVIYKPLNSVKGRKFLSQLIECELHARITVQKNEAFRLDISK
jgi:hypothetical protein